MAVETISAWLMGLVFMSFSPEKMYPNNVVDQQEYKNRVEYIIDDIIDVVYVDEGMTAFQGPKAKAYEAAMVTIISAEESGGYKKDVEAGIQRGDNGSSWCLMAINIGRGRTYHGWTGSDLISDRKKCLKAGLDYARKSIGYCKSNGYDLSSGLSVYNTGKCIKDERISVSRMRRILSSVHNNIPNDVDVKNILSVKE